MNRRELLKISFFSLPLFNLPLFNISASDNSAIYIKPKKLQKGNKISIVAPGSAVNSPDDIQYAISVLKFHGLEYEIAPSLQNSKGYKTKSAQQRADDINNAFDSDSHGIICIRGGYGSAGILDYLDYQVIKNNPKIFCGFSDITALHLAITQQCNLVTFHSPVLMSDFNEFTSNHFSNMIFANNEYPNTLSNPDNLKGVRREFPTRRIVGGKSKGMLTGGNLSLISSLMGTKYEIDTKDKIVFLEEVGEAPYRIDRMLTQLKMAGKFDDAKGVIFGKCDDCSTGSTASTWDLSLGEILDNILGDLSIPVFYGLMFGHTSHQLTIPYGIMSEIDSDKGVLHILESPLS